MRILSITIAFAVAFVALTYISQGLQVLKGSRYILKDEIIRFGALVCGASFRGSVAMSIPASSSGSSRLMVGGATCSRRARSRQRRSGRRIGAIRTPPARTRHSATAGARADRGG